MQKTLHSLLILIVCCITTFSFAQKNSQKELELERKRLKTEIKKVNKLLFSVQKEGKSALEDLKDLNYKIGVRDKLIKTIELASKSLQKDINENQIKVAQLEKEIVELKKDYGDMIYQSYKSKSQQSKTLFLLSSKSFNQVYKRLKYMNQYTDFRKKQWLQIKAQTKALEVLHDSLMIQKSLKDSLIVQEERQKGIVENDKVKQELLVSKIKKNERKYKRELKKKIAREKKLSAEIDKIIKEAIAKANAKANAKVKNNSSKTNTTPATKKSTIFALTPEAKALAVSFETNKGKLPWPVRSGIVTRRFGKQAHPTIPGITIQSTGLHIVTEKASVAESIFKGSVMAIHTLAEGKKSVLVRHGNYITAYNNLEEVYVSEGDKVSTGEVLGKIFTDKVTGKTKLIFVLFKNTKRLNPSSWILKR